MSRTRGRLIALVLVAFVATLAMPSVSRAQDPTPPPGGGVLHLFWAEGCPYCAAEQAWLPQLEDRYPELEVRQYEISGSQANRDLWVAMTTERGVEPTGVPTTIVGDGVWVGFDEERIGPLIEAAVARAVAGADVDAGAAPDETTIPVPFLGDVELGQSSLVLSTLLIGFVDGFNPCSLWVLSLLLALVLHTGSRRRVLAVGATFLVITTALYGVYMAGVYSVLSYIAYVTWIRVGVAGLAGAVGVIGIKDYFALHRGPSLSIPDAKKPALLRRMRSVAMAERSLPSAIAGTAAMAVGVSLIETPCTAGFPVVWANLLAANDTSTPTAAALFALYMLVFLLDELAIFGVAVVTMRAAKLQERHGRVLKLVGGVVMLTLAVVMIVAPELLEDVTGTAIAFGGAAVVTMAILGGHRLVTGGRGSRPSGRRQPPAGVRQV